MEPHQQRVIDEKRELDEKSDRLSMFLETAGDDGRYVDPLELSRLRVQHAIMDAYCVVLAERIANF